MWKKVADHSLYWSKEYNSGTLTVKLNDKSQGEIKHLSKLELIGFSEMFRNEKHVWFHTTRGDITTETRPADEEDRV